MTATCAVSACGRPTRGRQPWCDAHYRRALRHGDPTAGRKEPAPRGSGHLDVTGYRYLLVDGKRVAEHRVVWERHHGPIPPGFHVHHRNHVRDDNRIENLELLPAPDHGRLHARMPTHCSQGHEFTSENTWSHLGERHCRACHRERNRETARRRAARERAANPPTCPDCGNTSARRGARCKPCERSNDRRKQSDWQRQRRAAGSV